MSDTTMENVYAKRRARWQKLLRSGDFKQGRRQLRGLFDDQDMYCCLGVGCELFREETGVGLWDMGSYSNYYFIYNRNNSSYLEMPQPIGEWFGLHEIRLYRTLSIRKSHSDVMGILAECNDMLGWDFEQIAELIGWLENPEEYKEQLLETIRKISERGLS